jgi:DNA-binding Lrp family transcriptional regulator
VSVERLAMRRGLTLSTARWVGELARELGVSERRLLKAVLRLSKRGVWLEDEDWRFIARYIDLSRHLDAAVNYILRRVASGAQPAEAVREVPAALERAGRLARVVEILSSLL